MHPITLKILRGNAQHQWWESFHISMRPSLNVIAALMDIQKKPITTTQNRTLPVAWESGCLEEVCGSCSMLINGIPRQACTALIEKIVDESRSSEIILAPLTKFPLIRDLVVDRSIMFEHLKRIQAWVEVDGYHPAGFGPAISEAEHDAAYPLARCMTCGCCSEACPKVNAFSSFIGPSPIAQVRLLDLHPTSRLTTDQRLRTLQGKGGISGCGNAQNCVRVCPKLVPLTDAIAWAGRATGLQALKDWFCLPPS